MELYLGRFSQLEMGGSRTARQVKEGEEVTIPETDLCSLFVACSSQFAVKLSIIILLLGVKLQARTGTDRFSLSLFSDI